MSKQKYWQAEASFPGGGTFVFGVTGRSLPAALLKAYQHAAELPGVPDHLMIVRLYPLHHPLRVISLEQRLRQVRQ